MLKDMAENEFGPPIRFREYSLFDNPLMPQEVYTWPHESKGLPSSVDISLDIKFGIPFHVLGERIVVGC